MDGAVDYDFLVKALPSMVGYDLLQSLVLGAAPKVFCTVT